MQATESHAAGPLLDRLRTFASDLSVRASRARVDTTVENAAEDSAQPSRLSLEETRDDLEPLELPDDWKETDLAEAGIR